MHPNGLRRHQKTHDSPKHKFECPVDDCSTTIGRLDNLKRHVIKEHPEFDTGTCNLFRSDWSPQGSKLKNCPVQVQKTHNTHDCGSSPRFQRDTDDSAKGKALSCQENEFIKAKGETIPPRRTGSVRALDTNRRMGLKIASPTGNIWAFRACNISKPNRPVIHGLDSMSAMDGEQWQAIILRMPYTTMYSGRHYPKKRSPRRISGASLHRPDWPTYQMFLQMCEETFFSATRSLGSRYHVNPSRLGRIANELSLAPRMHQRATFTIKWELLEFLDGQLDAPDALSTLFVVTGTESYAYASTCADCLNRNWPGTGNTLLSFLISFLRDLPPSPDSSPRGKQTIKDFPE